MWKIPPTLTEDRFYWPDSAANELMDQLDTMASHALALGVREASEEPFDWGMTCYFEGHIPAQIAPPVRFPVRGWDGAF